VKEYEELVNLQEKPKNMYETYPTTALFTRNPTCAALEAKPGHNNEKLATNCLNSSTVHPFSLLFALHINNSIKYNGGYLQTKLIRW
jgi:hypothetical protein